MKVAIVGLKGSGKTTIFNSLTKTNSNIAIVKVPDKRLDNLHNLYQQKKKVLAEIEFIKVEDKRSLHNINIDGLGIVIKCFQEEIEPIKELNTILQDLLLSDLLIVEKRLLSSKDPEKALLERCKENLSQEIPIRKLNLQEEERKRLSSYQFLTQKPIILICNVSEEISISQKIDELKEYARIKDLPLVSVYGKFEKELLELEEKEKEAFRKELGIADGIANLIRLVYDTLNLISFFTIGKNEVRQWTIPKGTNVLKAAGKIHSDIERGFIKASVIAYEDFIDCGSMQHAKERGKIRVEGKDYIVKDGDIIEFKFNV